MNHPEIDWIERTGYPSWMQEDNYDQDTYDACCDALYEERRERELHTAGDQP